MPRHKVKVNFILGIILGVILGGIVQHFWDNINSCMQSGNNLGQRFLKQRRLQEAQVIGEIGSQVGDIARTQGEIAAQKVAGRKMDHASKADREKAQRDWENANPGKTATHKDISGQLYQNFYNQAFTETGLGTGGKVQQAIRAATAAIQGLAGSDLKAAIAGGAAPYIATVIAKAIPGEGADALAARTMAHAAVNAALAKAQGNNALAGAAGAATAEMMAPAIIAGLGWDQNNLSETQKQTVSALSTLAARACGRTGRREYRVGGVGGTGGESDGREQRTKW